MGITANSFSSVDLMLAAAGKKLTTAGVELHMNDGIGMALVTEYFLAVGQIPVAYGPVVAAGEGRFALGRQGDAQHRAGVAIQAQQLLLTRPIP